MKRILAVAVIVGAGLAGGRATVQASGSGTRFLAVQYQGAEMPPVPIAAIYNVNGVNYPVDYNRRIWGRNAYGVWVVAGYIESGPYGDIAVRGNQRFPATRVE